MSLRLTVALSPELAGVVQSLPDDAVDGLIAREGCVAHAGELVVDHTGLSGSWSEH